MTNPDLRISVSVGFTLNLGNYQSAKYELTASGINPALPIGPQIETLTEHLSETALYMENQVYLRLKDNDLIAAVRERKP